MRYETSKTVEMLDAVRDQIADARRHLTNGTERQMHVLADLCLEEAARLLKLAEESNNRLRDAVANVANKED